VLLHCSYMVSNKWNSLRRYHFHPRSRAGFAGGNEPSLGVIKKYWLRTVEERNRRSPRSDDGDDGDDEEEEKAAVDDLDDDEQRRQRDGRYRQLRLGLSDGGAREEERRYVFPCLAIG